jgi:hypothetical protein
MYKYQTVRTKKVLYVEVCAHKLSDIFFNPYFECFVGLTKLDYVSKQFQDNFEKPPRTVDFSYEAKAFTLSLFKYSYDINGKKKKISILCAVF